MPNAEIVTLEAISGEESGEDDPVPGASSRTGLKHSFGPTEDVGPPLPDESESDVGTRLTPDDLRRLIRAFVEAHPDFAWAPIASSDPDEAFSVGPILADVAPLSDGLDPKPPVREPDAIDTMETDAIDALIEAAECHDETPGEGCDVAPSQELIDEIRGRRETITGITERPNRRTRIADEEDMWTDETEGGR